MNGPPAVENIASRLPPKGRLIGVDLGAKTIGLALSDVERRLASPLKALKRVSFVKSADALLAACSEYSVVGLVIGLPLDLEGRDTPSAQSARAFGQKLATKTDLPIAFWDERFSTAATQRSLIEKDVSRARRAQVIDKMAAAYILQGALDRLAAISQQPRSMRISKESCCAARGSLKERASRGRDRRRNLE